LAYRSVMIRLSFIRSAVFGIVFRINVVSIIFNR